MDIALYALIASALFLLGIGVYKNSRRMVFASIMLGISCLIIGELSGVAAAAAKILLLVITVIIFLVSEYRDH